MQVLRLHQLRSTHSAGIANREESLVGSLGSVLTNRFAGCLPNAHTSEPRDQLGSKRDGIYVTAMRLSEDGFRGTCCDKIGV